MLSNSDSPKTNILIDPIHEDLTASTENIIHMRNIDRIDELERKIAVQNTWSSCCLKTDKRAVIYFSQFSLTASVMILCMYQLIAYPHECEHTNIYVGLLTFIMGVYLPQPKINK